MAEVAEGARCCHPAMAEVAEGARCCHPAMAEVAEGARCCHPARAPPKSQHAQVLLMLIRLKNAAWPHSLVESEEQSNLPARNIASKIDSI
jgi:hypothetical protein